MSTIISNWLLVHTAVSQLVGWFQMRIITVCFHYSDVSLVCRLRQSTAVADFFLLREVYVLHSTATFFFLDFWAIVFLPFPLCLDSTEQEGLHQ